MINKTYMNGGKPKSKSFTLALLALLVPVTIGPLNAFLRRIFDPVSLIGRPKINLFWFSPGIFGAFVSLGCAISAVYYVVKEYKSGSRSWKMWVAALLGGFIAAFWLFMIIGEFIYPH